MNKSVKVITPPTLEPLTVAEMEMHLRSDNPGENDYLTALITAAREYCEDYTGQALITRTLELTLDKWPGVYEELRLPGAPLLAVSSIKYYTDTNAEVVFDAANYFADTAAKPGRLALAYNCAWPTANLRPIAAIKIQYTAGYGATAALVPAKFKQAIKLIAAHWYERREETITGTTANAVPFAAHALLNQERLSF
jgi:uncharacterized phiE125 gp8 family phage protein